MILASSSDVPGYGWVSPFAVLLLCIAILPIIPATAHWWHHNRNKLIVAVALALITLGYYFTRPQGFGHGDHHAAPGMPAVLSVLDHAVLGEFVPFISLLFALYVIAGGISIRGDLPAHPLVNTTFLAVGGALASIIGTTGASMLLIRPLLMTNSERKHVRHTVIFFIFIVSNIGGCLLPIGDPPLFLGYLRGVPFLWTLHLWKEWAFCLAILLTVYYMWDLAAYRKETPMDIELDETQRQPLKIRGWVNVALLLGVVAATGLLDPSKPVPGTNWTPAPYTREGVQTALVILSLIVTPSGIRKLNEFNYTPILEVACLFIGIFICMQVPIEILNATGDKLGVDTPTKFFWATGALSSFLDNAPTYVVFFETANSLTHAAGPGIQELLSGHFIRQDLLVAISLGAVFMGANTYIGNGPNFMVKSIAEESGIKMPSFFGYMLYSAAILLPLFGLVTWFFM